MADQETALVKISVFADDGQAVLGGLTPDGFIGAGLKSNIAYVYGTGITINKRLYQTW